MKNKRIVVPKSSDRKNMRKASKKTELGLDQLLIDAAHSKKAADELLKWYTNSN